MRASQLKETGSKDAPKMIWLLKAIADQLLDIAIKHYEEKCAILFGESKIDSFHFDRIVEAENLLHSPTQFEIDPEFLWHKFVENEKHYGDNMGMGIFHTHPPEQHTPSQVDFQFMRNWNVPWLIGSRNDKPGLKAYILLKDQITEIQIHLFDQNSLR